MRSKVIVWALRVKAILTTSEPADRLALIVVQGTSYGVWNKASFYVAVG